MSLELRARILPASNATFIGRLDDVEVVYKPVAGERPLWDFPDGTLAEREVAAYEVSEALGWNVVPRTWLGEGPHGPGMLQLWQDVDPEQEAVTLALVSDGTPTGWHAVFEALDGEGREVVLVHEESAALRRMALFDVVTNNADRKGGHVLEMAGGHRYGVDHGLTFHAEPKLRTVLWGWADSELSADEVAALERLRTRLAGGLGDALADLITAAEIEALDERCVRLLAAGRFPSPSAERFAIPWPPF